MRSSKNVKITLTNFGFLYAMHTEKNFFFKWMRSVITCLHNMDMDTHDKHATKEKII